LFLLIPLFVLLGLFVGSFLNVCIDRLPQEESIITPPSHCPSCNRRVGIIDLVPVFSYIWLRGRCRYCQAHIPLRLPIVEGITGLLFFIIFWQFNYELSLSFAITLAYACILLIIFFIDLENQLILNRITYPAMIIALGFSLLLPEISEVSPLVGGITGRLISSVVGGTIGLVFMAIPLIIYRRGMGIGDIKLGLLIGLMTGFPLVFVALLMSVIVGGVISIILLIFKIKSRKDAIPFGPFMAAAAIVTLLWGQAIWQWYI
jgi:leader peptidase (prepilin peptidase)/N-methyltransferase